MLCSTECNSLDGVSFWGVSGLESLDTLEGITKVSTLILLDNPDLKNIRGIEGASIKKGINIDGNNTLMSLSGVTEDELHHFHLENNNSLKNLDGLESVESIGYSGRDIPGKLKIAMNTGLRSLKGLSNVEELYTLRIVDNANLKRISGLSKVKTVEGHFSIANNPSLKSIESLMGIETLEKGLNITNNPSLPSCQVQKFVENVDVNENYQVSVGNNGSGSCE